jgi:hypothetical protein
MNLLHILLPSRNPAAPAPSNEHRNPK